MKAILILLGAALAQAAPAQTVALQLMDSHVHPAFEVATIRPSDPEDQSSGFHSEGQRIFVENERMSDILAVAFNVHKQQLINLPDWCTSARLDIHGYGDHPGIPSWPQQQEMLRSLLQQRLGLRLHHENRDLAHATLRAPAGAAKLTAAKPQEYDLPDQTGNGSGGKQDWRITNNSMADFAGFLRNFVDQPMVDQTGLTGKYDFKLAWAREDAAPGADTGSLPGLVTALREQFGLRLDREKGPMDILVIDHLDRPSPD